MLRLSQLQLVATIFFSKLTKMTNVRNKNNEYTMIREDRYRTSERSQNAMPEKISIGPVISLRQPQLTRSL